MPQPGHKTGWGPQTAGLVLVVGPGKNEVPKLPPAPFFHVLLAGGSGTYLNLSSVACASAGFGRYVLLCSAQLCPSCKLPVLRRKLPLGHLVVAFFSSHRSLANPSGKSCPALPQLALGGLYGGILWRLSSGRDQTPVSNSAVYSACGSFHLYNS